MENKDVIIIGAGIAGLSASIYLKRANIDFLLLEGKLPGGLLNSLKEVDNYPGFPSSSGKDILLSLMEQIKELGINVDYGNVQMILKDKVGFKVVSDKNIYYSKAVIIASGKGMSEETLPGEKEYFGRGVSYCATCDGLFFKDDDVLVYGNNDTAIEEALYLANIVHHLYFVVDGEKLLGEQNNQDLLKKMANVEFIYDQISKINGDILGVNSVTLASGITLNVHGVFPYVGQKKATDFLASLHPYMDKGYIKTNDDMETDIKGLFAIGDIRYKKLYQLVTAASDGATSSLAVIKYLRSLK